MKYPPCVNWNNRFYVIEGRFRRLKVEVICPDCKESRFVDRRNIDGLLKSGSFTGRCQSCHVHLCGENKSGAWKGGRHLSSSNKYMYLTITPKHRFWSMVNKRNEIAEHRLVMARRMNRPLSENEHVHHIDGNRLNNDSNNLLLMSKLEHLRLEATLSNEKGIQGFIKGRNRQIKKEACHAF